MIFRILISSMVLISILAVSCKEGEGSSEKVAATNTIINKTSLNINLMMFGDKLLNDTLFSAQIKSQDSLTIEGECLVGWKSSGGCTIGWDEYQVITSMIVFEDQKQLIYQDGGCISRYQIYELPDGSICRDRDQGNFNFRYEITEQDYSNAN